MEKTNKDYVNLLLCLSFFYNLLIPIPIYVRKLFSCDSKLTHALLALKKRPFNLQKMPF